MTPASRIKSVFSEPWQRGLRGDPFLRNDLPLEDHGTVFASEIHRQLLLVRAAGSIVVTAQRDLLVGGAIPGGAGVRRYHYNTLTFTLPDTPALKQAVAAGKSIHVAAEVQSSGGRLFKDRAPDRVFSDKEGSREIWWQEGVLPGAEQTFYYAWTAAPPSGAPSKEVVTVKVLSPSKTDLDGTVSFEVGIDLKVVGAGSVGSGEIEVLKRLPLRIAIEDGFHPGQDVAALLAKLDVAPVLKVEHTSYERPEFMGFVVDVFGFDIFNWGEWVMATQMDVHAKDPKKRPSVLHYDDYAWNVGEGGVLGGRAGERMQSARRARSRGTRLGSVARPGPVGALQPGRR